MNDPVIRPIPLDRLERSPANVRRTEGSVAKSGWLVTCLRDLERGVEA